MSLRSRRARLDKLFVILAGLGLLAAFQAWAFRDSISYPWVKLSTAVGFAAVCIVAIRERENIDVLLSIVAAVFTMLVIAVLSAVDVQDSKFWPLLLGFAGSAILFVLLTKNRVGALIGIGAIIGFRLLAYLVLS
jgi:hypothetical protein